LRRLALHTRDACDRFLPSTASISSTRVSFALDEVSASRLRTFSASAFTTDSGESMIEHPAISRRRGGSGGPSLSIRSTQCRACRASPRCRLSDLSAAAHTIEAAPRLLPARPVKASPLCNRARLPSRGTFHRLTSCDACRVRSETRFLRTSLLGSGGFAATGPRAALLHRDDPALLLQAWWSRLGPRSRPRSD
jgi:hypothetical protein